MEFCLKLGIQSFGAVEHLKFLLAGFSNNAVFFSRYGFKKQCERGESVV